MSGAATAMRARARRRADEINAYELLFCISYGVWLSSQLLAATFFSAKIGTVLNLAKYAGLAGAVLSLLISKKFDLAEVASLFGLLLLCSVALNTNAPSFRDMLVMVYCGRRVPFHKLAHESVCISALLLLFTVLSSKIGLITNYVAISGDRRREYLGFRYALQPAQIMFNITCLAIFLGKDKLSKFKLVVLALCNIYIFANTDSRLSFGVSVLVLAVYLLLCWRGEAGLANGALRWITPALFIALFVLSWVLTLGYDPLNSFSDALNDFLGNRLALGHDAILRYGTTMLGQAIDFVGNGLSPDGKLNATAEYNYIDVLYVRLPILYGWVFTILILCALTYAAYRAARRKDSWLLLILLAIALHSLVDDLTIRLQFSTFLFMLWRATGEQANQFTEQGETSEAVIQIS